MCLGFGPARKVAGGEAPCPSVSLPLFLSFVLFPTLSFSLDMNKEVHTHSGHLQASRDHAGVLTLWVLSVEQKETRVLTRTIGSAKSPACLAQDSLP